MCDPISLLPPHLQLPLVAAGVGRAVASTEMLLPAEVQLPEAMLPLGDQLSICSGCLSRLFTCPTWRPLGF